MPPNEDIIIRGINFGKNKPLGSIAIDVVKIDVGSAQCFTTVSAWTATTITLQMCATTGTSLPVSITLGTKESPPFATTIKVKVAVECDPGRFVSSFFRDFHYSPSSPPPPLHSSPPLRLLQLKRNMLALPTRKQ